MTEINFQKKCSDLKYSDLKYSVLILGSGGRENAMARYFKRDCQICIHGASRNPELEALAEGWYSVGSLDPLEVLKIAEEIKPDLVIVGSENLLVAGVSDILTSNGISVLGPTKNLARIETSKIFSRRFLKSIDLEIHNPDYLVLKNSLTTKSHLKAISFWNLHHGQVVIKQDRLAGGKGVFVAGDHFNDRKEFDQILADSFQKGDVMLEEKLVGTEFSLISLRDQKGHVSHFPPVRDFKRRNCKNSGPNTGGMGATSLIVDSNNQHWVNKAQKINQTVLEELETIYIETNYSGFLYGSYMLTATGLKVIEFNARMGDPEGIGLFHTLQTPPSILVKHILDNSLDTLTMEFDSNPYVIKYLVPAAYPKSNSDSPKVILPTEDQIRKIVPEFRSKNIPSLDLCCAGLYDQDGDYLLGPSRTLAVIGQHVDHITASLKVDKVLDFIQTSNPSVKFHYRQDLGKSADDWELVQPIVFNDDEITYEKAGVNVATNQEVVEGIKKAVTDTHRNPDNLAVVKGGYGEFAGVVELNGAHHLLGKDFPALAATTDGVGTKSLLVRQELGLSGFLNLGQDLVNHCVNDLMCQGAQPVFFLDYIASSQINVREVKKFLEGCAKACLENNCFILGGETAEMPDVYKGDAYDLVGTMVGIFNQKAFNPKGKIIPGDVVLAFPSVGPHTNGYSLIRKVTEKVRFRGDQIPESIMKDWVTPHKSYKSVLDEFKRKKIKIRGIVHVTGGGLVENPPRIMPSHCLMEIKTSSWTMPESFQYLQKETGISDLEMRKTFNCGAGLLIVIPKDQLKKITNGGLDPTITEGVWQIGRILPRKISDVPVEFV